MEMTYQSECGPHEKWLNKIFFVGAVCSAMVLLAVALALVLRAEDSTELAFKQTYVFEVYLKGDGISTRFNNGIMTLSGTVAEESHKLLAEQAVKDIHGVGSVDNQLVVEGERPAKAMNADMREPPKSLMLVQGETDENPVALRVRRSLLSQRVQDARESVFDAKAEEIAVDEMAGNNGDQDPLLWFLVDLHAGRNVFNHVAQ